MFGRQQCRVAFFDDGAPGLPVLAEILNLTEDEFHARFANSPLLRPGLAHIKHVAQICLQNISS
jgi:hypothetical protein